MDGTELRAARRQRGVKLADLAARLKKDPSYLSHVENGRKPVTPQIEEAYRSLLDRSSINGDSAKEPTKSIIKSIIETQPYTKGRRSSLFTVLGERFAEQPGATKSLSLSDPHDDLAELFAEIAKLKDATDGRTVFLWNQLSSYKGTAIETNYHTIVQNCVDGDVPFAHFVVPSKNNSKAALDDVQWIIANSIRYIRAKEIVTFDTIQGIDFGMFEIDFLVVASKVADIRLAYGDFGQRKNGLIFTSAPQIEALLSYLRRIENHRDYRVSFFLGDKDLQRFFDAYSAADHEGGNRYIFQQFLGSYTLSPDNYLHGTSWWRRYSELGFDINRLADSRKRSTAALKARLQTSDVRQICSVDTLRAWAHHGIRPDIKARSVSESVSERKSRLDYVLHMLNTFERFSIALANDEAGKPLGWSPSFLNQSKEVNPERSLSWIVQGHATTMLESTMPAADNQRGQISFDKPQSSSTSGFDEFQCVIADHSVASAFTTAFDSMWKEIPGHQKNRREVIAFFEDLKTRIASG